MGSSVELPPGVYVPDLGRPGVEAAMDEEDEILRDAVQALSLSDEQVNLAGADANNSQPKPTQPDHDGESSESEEDPESGFNRFNFNPSRKFSV